MKGNRKVFGFEALYLLATVIVAGLSSSIQLIGREYESDYSSFIFSGHNYSYNAFYYIFGMAIFIGFMVAGYVRFLKGKMAGVNWSGFAPKVLFPNHCTAFFHTDDYCNSHVPAGDKRL